MAAGVYQENVTIDGKYVSLVASSLAGSVTLRPDSTARPLRSPLVIQNVPFRPELQAAVSGFTITGGNAPAGQGGGITIAPNASPLIENNVVHGNVASAYGGGIAIHSGSNPVIHNNIIRNNTAVGGGGGIFVVGNSSPVIIENQIVDNSVAGAVIVNGGSSGGAVYLENRPGAENDRSRPVLYDNDIRGNTAEFAGGGVMLRTGVDAILENNRIESNSASYGGGVHIETSGSSVTLTNNVIRTNKAVAAPAFPGSGYGGGVAIYDRSSVTLTGNAIEANTATQGGAGVSVSESASASLRRNNLSRNVAAGGDGGGLYVANATVVAENNVLHDNSARLGGGLAALDGARLDASHNTIVGNRESRLFGGAIFLRGGAGVVASIRSNVLSQNQGYQVFEEVTGTGTFDNNLFGSPSPILAESGSGIYYSYATHSIGTAAGLNALASVDRSATAEPEFTNVSARDFSVLPTSPAIGRADGVGPGVDYRGALRQAASRTLGAYEYGSTTIVEPVFRFWSYVDSSHFFTGSDVEKASILKTYDPMQWTYESVAFDAFASPVPGTVPIYRFWSDAFKGHFYTASEAEKLATENNFPDDVWRFEGIAYHAYPIHSAIASDTVYRFWSADNRHHFYTASEAERDHVIAFYKDSVWAYEGAQYRVPRR